MLKRLIRYICYRIISIGWIEKHKRDMHERTRQHERSAIIGVESLIGDTAILQNSQNTRQRIQIGRRCQVLGHLMLFKHGGEIRIGDDCFVGMNTRIWSASSISIGNRVLIAHGVNIHDNISHPLDSSERHLDYRHIFSSGVFQNKIDLRERPILIKDDVWIGFNAIIMKGVTIGRGAIVGAGTLVNSDVPDYAVVVGNPARIIKFVS